MPWGAELLGALVALPLRRVACRLVQGGTAGATGIGGQANITSGAGGTTSGASGTITIGTGVVTNTAGTANASGALTIQTPAGGSTSSTTTAGNAGLIEYSRRRRYALRARSDTQFTG